MDYAIIKIGSRQYKVAKGDVIEVENLKNNEKKIKLEEILLTSNDNKVKVGMPTVKEASIIASILGNKKGEKVRVSKFKSKVRYRKTSGFRQSLTRIQIEKIEF